MANRTFVAALLFSVLFPLAISCLAQDTIKVLILSPKVGPKITAGAREQFKIFPQFDSFVEATAFETANGDCFVRITLEPQKGVFRDTTVQYPHQTLLMIAEKINHFEDLAAGRYHIGDEPTYIKTVDGTNAIVPSRWGGDSLASWAPGHFTWGTDLFLAGEAYTLHFSRVGFFQLTGEGGLGMEIRVLPVFFGAIVGVTGHEMRLNPGGFLFMTLYGGGITQGYRLEVGRINGVHPSMEAIAPPEVEFTTYFLGISKKYGISKRYGEGFFIEPELKIMIPSVAGYYPGRDRYGYYFSAGERYGIRDLFVALGVKLGVGFDSYH
jgi:hypothetical protein